MVKHADVSFEKIETVTTSGVHVVWCRHFTLMMNELRLNVNAIVDAASQSTRDDNLWIVGLGQTNGIYACFGKARYGDAEFDETIAANVGADHLDTMHDVIAFGVEKSIELFGI